MYQFNGPSSSTGDKSKCGIFVGLAVTSEEMLHRAQDDRLGADVITAARTPTDAFLRLTAIMLPTPEAPPTAAAYAPVPPASTEPFPPEDNHRGAAT
jgi:hypothetical protein